MGERAGFAQLSSGVTGAGLVLAALCPFSAAAVTPAPACERCAPSNGWELDVTAGPGYVTGDDEFNFGNYTGLDDDGVYLMGDVFGRYWSESADYVRLEGYRLGRDSRAIFIEGGRQGLYEVRGFYQGIPVRKFDTTRTPYSGAGSDTLTLPSGWTRGATTGAMTDLNGSLQDVTIKQDWDVYGAGISFTPTTRWAFDVDYQRQDRNGKDIYGGAFFFNAAQLVRPTDYDTDSLDAAVSYNADTWQVRLSYYGSFFNNNHSSLTWDNAFASQAAGDDRGRLALPPDNESHQVSLGGSVLLPARTTLNGQVSVGRMEQTEGLQAYTINPVAGAAAGALPRDTAGARVETTNVNLRATSSPWRRFTVEGEFRYDERDNKTDENVYNYVVTDLAPSANSATNQAFDYQRFEYKLRGEYRIRPMRTRLHAGYDYKRHDRTRQERDRTKTDRVWFRLNARPMNVADLNVDIYTESRDGNNYQNFIEAADPQNPLMRKYNMADRDRTGARAYVNAYSGERATLGFELELNSDQYNNTEIGLQKADYTRYGFDASYLLTQTASAYGSLYLENYKSTQAGSQSYSDPDWIGKTNDDFWTATVGLRAPKLYGRLGGNVEYNYARSQGGTENNTGGLRSDFPDLRTTLHQVKLGLNYAYSPALSFSASYWYEKFDADDWYLEDVEPDTVPNLLSLGADPVDYKAHVFFIGARYMFDSRGQSGPRLPQQKDLETQL